MFESENPTKRFNEEVTNLWACQMQVTSFEPNQQINEAADHHKIGSSFPANHQELFLKPRTSNPCSRRENTG